MFGLSLTNVIAKPVARIPIKKGESVVNAK